MAPEEGHKINVDLARGHLDKHEPQSIRGNIRATDIPTTCGETGSAERWLHVEFDDPCGEYAIVVTSDVHKNSVPTHSKVAANCIMITAVQSLMGRFGLPNTLHSRRAAWRVENRNGVYEQFQFPPDWTALSHERILDMFNEALAAAHLGDARLRECDEMLALVLLSRGVPPAVGRGWLRPADVFLPEPVSAASLIEEHNFCVDEEFNF
mmetsp:Transcript_29379/g.51477  ORF Transcript_29379/g.51477 Transcript_29379/m.51477 type:complete len:209 (-) Transcript_29379:168-794(-)